MTDPVCRNCKRPRSEHYMDVCPTAKFEAVCEECGGAGEIRTGYDGKPCPRCKS